MPGVPPGQMAFEVDAAELPSGEPNWTLTNDDDCDKTVVKTSLQVRVIIDPMSGVPPGANGLGGGPGGLANQRSDMDVGQRRRRCYRGDSNNHDCHY
ncbi:hypothetical protein Zmor_006041 [Zophobas morio]|uniref:Uncharacterized protein n=1 Tax=Zophobas morio TaxID=2755281 RepID=A0AA38IU31_9CUCU|nr:hypothetical protein Zmor_006041 [Zophobas morio]